jgi:hypothetical protein
MNGSDSQRTWGAFRVIVGSAAGVASLSWIAWAVLSGWGIVVLTAGLWVSYCGVVVSAIRRAEASARVVVELAALSVGALIGMWILGASIALIFWAEPIGPPN